MKEDKIIFPTEGKIIIWTREDNLLKEINTTFSQLDILYEHLNSTYIFSYSDKKNLETILTSIYKLLNPYNRKLLLCSFYYDNIFEILNNSIPFVELYHNLLSQDIIYLIKYGDLYSVIQPIYNIKDNKLFGYEFLLRGRVNERIISPFELYQTAFDLNMQDLLDVRAREISVKKAARLINKDLKIFINFLPSTILNPESGLQQTFTIANLYEVPSSNLVFEIVEMEEIQDLDSLNNTFDSYRQNGTMVAMDDVGAGYASLSKLHKLLPDYVKIDRDLISNCDTNLSKLQIMQTIVELCKKLNIQVLAEGIERKEELEVAKSLGISLGQGFLLGKPSEDEVAKYMVI